MQQDKENTLPVLFFMHRDFPILTTDTSAAVLRSAESLSYSSTSFFLFC